MDSTWTVPQFDPTSSGDLVVHWHINARTIRRCKWLVSGLRGIRIPDKVETRLGTLEVKDGTPSKETVDKVHDNLDLA